MALYVSCLGTLGVRSWHCMGRVLVLQGSGHGTKWVMSWHFRGGVMGPCGSCLWHCRGSHLSTVEVITSLGVVL